MVIREVAARNVRVESFVDGHLHELVEHVQVVLAVGVDGEDEIAGVELAALQPIAQARQGQEVRLRHPLVHFVHKQRAAIVSGQPAFDLGARVVGRTVVDDDQLVDHRVQRVEDGDDGRFLVVRGNDRDASSAHDPLPVTNLKGIARGTTRAFSRALRRRCAGGPSRARRVPDHCGRRAPCSRRDEKART